jgi:hypothetical protein
MVIMGGEAAAGDNLKRLAEFCFSPRPHPTNPKTLVIPRRLISDNEDYLIVAVDQRGKRAIRYHSGEGSQPWEKYVILY